MVVGGGRDGDGDLGGGLKGEEAVLVVGGAGANVLEVAQVREALGCHLLQEPRPHEPACVGRIVTEMPPGSLSHPASRVLVASAPSVHLHFALGLPTNSLPFGVRRHDDPQSAGSTAS